MSCSPYVTVAPGGQTFENSGKPFYFCGVNCYYLMTRAADPGCQQEVLEVLDSAKGMGLTVIRTWAFNDGEQWKALQPRPGEFSEEVFVGLDFVIAEAGKRGLKLILALVNYWADYGGMAQYVRWSYQKRGFVAEAAKADDFYRDPWCQGLFHNYLVTLTSRVNTFNGIPYRDDNTIMAWSLANEPRCVGDYSGSILQGWVEETAEGLKMLDPNHMVTVGLEGFLGSSTPHLLEDNPYNAMDQGCDFARHSSSRYLDFASMHLWPDEWMGSAEEEHKLRFARRWINCHVDVCQDLGKPLVLTEFGKKPAGPLRVAFYQKVYEAVVSRAERGDPIAGSTFWLTAAPSYADYDGNTVYLCQQPGQAADAALPMIKTNVEVYERVLDHMQHRRPLAGSMFWAATANPTDAGEYDVHLSPLPAPKEKRRRRGWRRKKNPAPGADAQKQQVGEIIADIASQLPVPEDVMASRRTTLGGVSGTADASVSEAATPVSRSQTTSLSHSAANGRAESVSRPAAADGEAEAGCAPDFLAEGLQQLQMESRAYSGAALELSLACSGSQQLAAAELDDVTSPSHPGDDRVLSLPASDSGDLGFEVVDGEAIRLGSLPSTLLGGMDADVLARIRKHAADVRALNKSAEGACRIM